jgi:hypothetical protein
MFKISPILMAAAVGIASIAPALAGSQDHMPHEHAVMAGQAGSGNTASRASVSDAPTEAQLMQTPDNFPN